MTADKPKLVAGMEPTLDLGNGLTATLMHDFDRFSNGSMVMAIEGANAHLLGDGKPVGEYGVALGGTLYIEHGQRLWKIDAIKLFKMLVKAEEQQYLNPPIDPDPVFNPPKTPGPRVKVPTKKMRRS